MISPDGSLQKIALWEEDVTLIQQHWQASSLWWWEISPVIPVHLSTFYFSLCDFYLGRVPAAALCTAESHITGVSSHDFLFVYHILASSSHFAAFCLNLVTEEKHLCCTTEYRVHPKTDGPPPFSVALASLGSNYTETRDVQLHLPRGRPLWWKLGCLVN